MINSFKYAINGIKDAFKSEPNFRFHLLAAVLILIIAYFLKFSKIEIIVLTLTITFVIVSELINTAIEKLVDMYSLERSEIARAIKDISAASVLFCSIGASIVGLILFVEKLI